jgi:hypothetical protein
MILRFHPKIAAEKLIGRIVGRTLATVPQNSICLLAPSRPRAVAMIPDRVYAQSRND